MPGTNPDLAVNTNSRTAARTHYSAGQALAALQLLKDAVTILQLNFLLIFAILIPIGVPGLVLFGCRWRFARRPACRTAALWHWSLTLAHELACVWLFVQMSHDPPEPGFPNWNFLAAGYCLGAFTSLLALAEALARGAYSADSLPRYSPPLTRP